MNRVVARYLLLVVNCLFLTRNNLWYSAYFKVHFQYQIKVVLHTKFCGFFCLKSLMKYLLTDLLELLKIITWDI